MLSRCSSCVLPSNLPGIDIDENGKCTLCRKGVTSHNNKPKVSQDQSEKNFQAIIERLRGKGKYDCLVPLSGGKDSSYVLYVLVKKYNLKVLAFNFNNGFQHPQAVRNIETLVSELGVDLIIYRANQDKMRKLFKTFLCKAGEFCTPCNMLIIATKFRLARQNGIKAIMEGTFGKLDPGVAGISPALYFDRRYYLEVAKDILTDREKKYYLVPSYPLTALQRFTGMAPQTIEVLSYLNPSFAEIEETLREAGWERPHGAVQHGDCLLDSLKDYLIYKKWGCTELTGFYSSLVRNGEMTREKALEEALAKEQSEAPAVLPEFLKAIGMTESEFQDALKKDFREIPNIRNTLFFRLAKKMIVKAAQIRGKEYTYHE